VHFIKKHLIVLSCLSISAGILYNSWPLGHWLNLNVSKNSLASGLEAVGQPYNWLFIGGDILSSVIVIILCLLMLHKLKKIEEYRFVHVALLCTILFGIGTIVDALLPLRCVQGIESCPSFTIDHQLLAHGIFSIIASVFLFVSLVILWFYNRKNILLNVFLIGYIVFGAISLAEAVFPGKNGNWSQDYYITLCSVWIAVIPYTIKKALDTF
jgi:hypothetical protein